MIASVEVRLATRSDAAEIAAMSRDHIEYGLPWGWKHGRVAEAIDAPATNVAVVGSQGALVAFGIMSYLDDDAHLQLLAVRTACQRRGVGSAVLTWLEEVARSAGATRIRVEARRDNSAARDFYGAHGYDERRIRPAMYSGKVDGVFLVKILRSHNQPDLARKWK